MYIFKSSFCLLFLWRIDSRESREEAGRPVRWQLLLSWLEMTLARPEKWQWAEETQRNCDAFLDKMDPIHRWIEYGGGMGDWGGRGHNQGHLLSTMSYSSFSSHHLLFSPLHPRQTRQCQPRWQWGHPLYFWIQFALFCVLLNIMLSVP